MHVKSNMGMSYWTRACQVGHANGHVSRLCILICFNFICMSGRLAVVWRFQQGFGEVDAADYYKGVD